MTLEVIVLAAGKGTRMHSALPKVLHEIAALPMLAHVLEAAQQLSPSRIHIVCGFGAKAVREAIAESPQLHWVEQSEQLGTAHAVRQAMPHVAKDAHVLILYGDVPLIQPATLQQLVEQSGAGHLGLLTAHVENPTGYGRILRTDDGAVLSIIEEADANEEQRAIREINTGFMAASSPQLARWLDSVDNQNAQAEFYLTDVVAHAVSDGTHVATVNCADLSEILGVNSR
ncbi:MAG: bifunctional N-acetylglucosamine-1-phosphate uridyltransferase/glucosamine-1-phosphate acetyltransferase, partial [Gammaproteobacteria bacterium]|nr:bifunctional N-acetylglucosamine-1-phosphate uridyltransferase/glucosamine-1-phosphate acetyltransferase [Gammaproteobacteria bacterium]